jgi:Tol biopolymer transport system component
MDGALWVVDLATGTQRSLSRERNVTFPYDWAPDGKYLIGTPGGGAKPSLLALAGGNVTDLFATRVAVRGFRFSPDGKWVAYFMNDSGQDQVYVAAFPAMDRKRQISTTGGRFPVWRRDGKELYFVAPNSMLMAAEIRIGAGMEASFPKPLFKLNISSNVNQYSASADGRRFLVNDLLTDDPRKEVTVVLNWTSELQR